MKKSEAKIVSITDATAWVVVTRGSHEPDTEGHTPDDVLEALQDLVAPRLDNKV